MIPDRSADATSRTESMSASHKQTCAREDNGTGDEQNFSESEGADGDILSAGETSITSSEQPPCFWTDGVRVRSHPVMPRLPIVQSLTIITGVSGAHPPNGEHSPYSTGDHASSDDRSATCNDSEGIFNFSP